MSDCALDVNWWIYKFFLQKMESMIKRMKCIPGSALKINFEEDKPSTYQACRAQIGSISVTDTTAPMPLIADAQPFPT